MIIERDRGPRRRGWRLALARTRGVAGV